MRRVLAALARRLVAVSRYKVGTNSGDKSPEKSGENSPHSIPDRAPAAILATFAYVMLRLGGIVKPQARLGVGIGDSLGIAVRNSPPLKEG
jgi:hypothetical protein